MKRGVTRGAALGDLFDVTRWTLESSWMSQCYTSARRCGQLGKVDQDFKSILQEIGEGTAEVKERVVEVQSPL